MAKRADSRHQGGGGVLPAAGGGCGCLLETVKEATTTNTQTLYHIIWPEYALSICFAAILFPPTTTTTTTKAVSF